MGGETFDLSRREICFRDAWRELLVVPKQDHLWRMLSHGAQEVYRVAEEDGRFREALSECTQTHCIRFGRGTPLDAHNIARSRNDHRDMSSFQCTS